MSSISKQLFLIVGFAYVDDCDIFQTAYSPLEVLNSMQQLINSWGSITEVTGGAISASKCWWYLIDFVWQRGRWVPCDELLSYDLQAKNYDGKIVSLKRLRNNEAAEQLGVWIAPNGDRQFTLEKNA